MLACSSNIHRGVNSDDCGGGRNCGGAEPSMAKNLDTDLRRCVFSMTKQCGCEQQQFSGSATSTDEAKRCKRWRCLAVAAAVHHLSSACFMVTIGLSIFSSNSVHLLAVISILLRTATHASALLLLRRVFIEPLLKYWSQGDDLFRVPGEHLQPRETLKWRHLNPVE